MENLSHGISYHVSLAPLYQYPYVPLWRKVNVPVYTNTSMLLFLLFDFDDGR